MSTERKMVIPPDFNLARGVEEIQGGDGNIYLQFATGMVTLYKQTYGELSVFFKGLRAGKLIGSFCENCKQVMVPAATWHCPDCDFAEMMAVELPHQGILAYTAPITIFPSAPFFDQVPFARGYVDVALNYPIASYMPSRLRTTTGAVKPGMFVRGLELKLVFKDVRVGEILDVFWVPMSEVPEHLRSKEPLLVSELSFETPKPPNITFNSADVPAYNWAIQAMQEMARYAMHSPRAQKDLGEWNQRIGVKTSGGEFTLIVADRKIEVREGWSNPDFELSCLDPNVFERWARDGSLTDAVVECELWLPTQEAFLILPVLDRVPRSVRRDLELSK